MVELGGGSPVWLRWWGQSSSCRDPECKSFWKLGGWRPNLRWPDLQCNSICLLFCTANHLPSMYLLICKHKHTHHCASGWLASEFVHKIHVYHTAGGQRSFQQNIVLQEVVPEEDTPRGLSIT